MYKVFNSNIISSKSRFLKGLLYGSIVSIILALLYGFIAPYIMVEFSLLFIIMGMLIGKTIAKFGRGVTIEFSILGAILTLFTIIISDMIAYFSINSLLNINTFILTFNLYIKFLFSANINSILSLLFRIVGIYAAFENSRVV